MLRRADGLAAVCAVTLIAHLLTLSRYGFYRDELYFLVCAQHLAWGYADQPPLVVAIGAVAAAAGNSIVVLRLLPALAAVATCYAAATLNRRLGGSHRSATLTAALVALMPASLFLGNTLTTTSFEPLTWTLLVLAVVRLRERYDAVWFAVLALTCIVGAYAKYAIFLPIAALAVTLVAFRDRRSAAYVVAAGALAVVALIPNIVWQAQHGFPMAAVLAGDVTSRHAFNSGFQPEYTDIARNALVFLVFQFVVAGIFAAPFVIAGLRNSRLIAVVFALCVVVALVADAKAYYLAGLYPALLAAGCARSERWTARIRTIAAYAAVIGGLIMAPLFMPLLPPVPRFPNPLLADEFGWPSFTETVAGAYHSLPPRVRSRVTVFADTYGDAAALDLYGPRFRLPKPISAQNQYYLWGTRGSDMRTVLAVGASQYTLLTQLYGSVVQIAVYRDEYRWAAEGPTPIYLCTRPRADADEIWRRLRWLGA